MPTVSEQLHLYQAYKANQSSSPASDGQADVIAKTGFRHPQTAEFFKMLMQNWQNNRSASNTSND